MQGVLDKVAKFGIVGLSGIVIDFSLTWLLKEKFRMNKFAANATGFTTAVINNFLLNKIWTFRNTSPDMLQQFVLFLLISTVGLALSTLVVYLLHAKKNIPFYISKLLAIGCVFCWNFIGNSLLTFNQP